MGDSSCIFDVVGPGVGGARECKLSGRCRDIELEISQPRHCFVYLLIGPGPRAVRQNAELKRLVGPSGCRI